MKKVLLALLGLVALCVVVVVANTARHSATAESRAVAPVTVAVDSAGAIARLATAVQFQTISYEEGTRAPDSAAFRALHEHLRTSFPLVHQHLTRETVAGLALLYTWKGSDTTLAPVVLMGHLDVVPVIPGTEAAWTQPPFSGAVADGFIWGRGTLDDKVSVLAVLEGAEGALRAGFQPKRTIYFAFGHDEEVGGSGARALKAELIKRGIKAPALVLDEGGAIMPGAVVGAKGTVALIGASEKGFLSLQLTVKGTGGHSSTPPAHTAIGRLATAITRLEQSPFPLVLDGPSRQMMERLQPAMPYAARMAMSNLWLFGPMVVKGMAAKPAGAAMLRTTTAVTIVSGGVKANVLPIAARATVNFRIRPGETIASVTERVRQVIADSGVAIEAVGFRTEPSPVSDASGLGFKVVERSLREIFSEPDLIVTPYLVTGGTDARNWSDVSSQTFRFLAAPMTADALTRAHGTNERVALGGYLSAVRFYERLLRNTDGL
ncbi:MAG TPA: M20 family peptidase [Gemmatimonadaceae bacterium]|jgi:carboxypeptidase PM20D1